jgi:cell division protein ZapE
LIGLEGAHDLSRTLSRLAEMQSRAYRSTLEDHGHAVGKRTVGS